jgi:MOB kinase activator 1
VSRNDFWTKVIKSPNLITNKISATYLWADDVIVEPIELPAKGYVDHLMDWIQRTLFNEKIFPTNEGNSILIFFLILPAIPFPAVWRPTIEQMMKRLIRVYGHIYFCHFPEIQKKNLEKKLNQRFTHFYSFVVSYDLVAPADMEPMQYVIEPLNGRIKRVFVLIVSAYNGCE